ncbi:cyclic pyranopterin monophosphate synthase, mitochondrial isoform X1 [Oryza brachyantha]|nr:cyclic pyranopterin monophosphate synthase, mitochondrial isoform X1 [Oryza brachyantha]
MPHLHFTEALQANLITMSIFRSLLPTVPRKNGWRCFVTGFPSDTIAELNKEMESVFGESPAPSPLGSSPPQQPARPTNGSGGGQPVLTHVDSSGQAKMVDVSSKNDSTRVAVATCRVLLGQKAFDLVASNQIAKGDVLTVAKIAGITGAKQTSNLIPLCHNLNISHVRVDLTLNEEDSSVMIEGEASTNGKTGVEMEAMTAVAIAGLTVYDMCKAVSKNICITDICLQHKSGGKSGSWSRS